MIAFIEKVAQKKRFQWPSFESIIVMMVLLHWGMSFCVLLTPLCSSLGLTLPLAYHFELDEVCLILGLYALSQHLMPCPDENCHTCAPSKESRRYTGILITLGLVLMCAELFKWPLLNLDLVWVQGLLFTVVTALMLYGFLNKDNQGLVQSKVRLCAQFATVLGILMIPLIHNQIWAECALFLMLAFAMCVLSFNFSQYDAPNKVSHHFMGNQTERTDNASGSWFSFLNHQQGVYSVSCLMGLLSGGWVFYQQALMGVSIMQGFESFLLNFMVVACPCLFTTIQKYPLIPLGFNIAMLCLVNGWFGITLPLSVACGLTSAGCCILSCTMVGFRYLMPNSERGKMPGMRACAQGCSHCDDTVESPERANRSYWEQDSTEHNSEVEQKSSNSERGKMPGMPACAQGCLHCHPNPFLLKHQSKLDAETLPPPANSFGLADQSSCEQNSTFSEASKQAWC